MNATQMASPPSHTLTFVMALLFDGLVVYGITWSWLTVRATARPAYVCDCGEDA